MDLLDAHVALRLDAFRRHRPYVESPAAEAQVRSYLGPHHAEGEVRALEREGRVDALVAWHYVPESWFGAPSWNIAIDHREDAPPRGVGAWLQEVLAPVLPTLEGELDVLVDASYRPAYAAMRRLGLGVDSVQLVGEVGRALEGLGEAPLPPGVRVEPMTEADLDEVFELVERTFVEEPEHGWFCALPAYVAQQRRELEAATRDPDALQLVVRTPEGLAGHLGSAVNRDNPFWGPSASIGICLAPSARGRRWLRPLYRVLLDEMRARGLRVFRGGTSRPAVMHLGRVMDRTLQGVNLRRGAPFSEAHFATWLVDGRTETRAPRESLEVNPPR